MNNKKMPIQYEHEYRCRIFVKNLFFRMIVVTRHLDKYKWSVWKSQSTNSPIDLAQVSGVHYDYKDPQQALKDAKEYISKELDNQQG